MGAVVGVKLFTHRWLRQTKCVAPAQPILCTLQIYLNRLNFKTRLPAENSSWCSIIAVSGVTTATIDGVSHLLILSNATGR